MLRFDSRADSLETAVGTSTFGLTVATPARRSVAGPSYRVALVLAVKFHTYSCALSNVPFVLQMFSRSALLSW